MTKELFVFDLKDGILVRKILELKDANVPFTLKELSEESLIPYKTVERRIARMKTAGLITNRRLGRRWLWELNNLETPLVDTASSRAFMILKGEGQNLKPSRPCLRVVKEAPHETPQSSKTQHSHLQEDPHETPHVTPHETPQLPNDIGNTNILLKHESYNILYPFASDSNQIEHSEEIPNSSRKETPMVKITGPNTELKQNLEQTLMTSRRPTKKKLTSMNSTPQARLKQRMKEKEKADYNVTDLRFVYENLWSDKHWKGFAPGWTMKDKKLLRNLLNEQGGENTVRYFQYVVEEWEDIQRRYRLHGAPNVSILWSYRSSLLPEALNDVSKRHASPTLEFAGEKNLTADDRSF